MFTLEDFSTLCREDVQSAISDNIERLRGYSEDLIPVLCARDRKVLGVITARDVTEIVDAERGDDYAKLAAMSSEQKPDESLFTSMKKRVPWLIALLFMGLIAMTDAVEPLAESEKMLSMPHPNEKQRKALREHCRYVGYGGARGGGKSWAVRIKAVLLCLTYPGIKILITRKTYRELLNNHIVVAVIYAATALPFTIYLLSSYFATLPHDFEEAAYIDGAGYWRTMLEIIFPMAKPSIITVILFNFLSFWNEYIIIKTLVTDRDQWTLPAGLLNLMQAQQSAAEYGPMYAGLVLVMLPVLILYICVQKNLTKGMTVGGLKG